ncbi:MAG: U32 family peptidase [Eubacteriales bacterium]|nr:U32 family peptidase [Eubacteriales bacterium]
MNEWIKKPELLAPAGSYENLVTAVKYGADAVYMGGSALGLRAKAKNFTKEEMIAGIAYARANNVKAYVTANVFAHNEDIQTARKYLVEIGEEIKPDALIVADPGLLMLVREVLPDMEVHMSTQANNTNYLTYRFWFQQGVKRAVLARELSLKEIVEIKANIPYDMEIEGFVHGAMCMSYSGRCLISNFLTGQDANRGSCTQSCRWKYHLVEETRPGEYMPVMEDEKGTYFFNSKDLCMINHLEDVIPAGIDSLKIEGRMKTPLYIATVVKAYRQAIDLFFENPQEYEKKKDYFLEEVGKCSHRHFDTGFFYGIPENGQIYENSSYIKDYVFTAKVIGFDEKTGLHHIEQRNKFSVGDDLEILTQRGENLQFKVGEILTETGETKESATLAKEKLYLRLPGRIEPETIIRKPSRV